MSASGILPANGTLLVEERDGIVRFALNRPERHNALDLDLLHALADALFQLKESKTAKVLVIQAVGRNFCSGVDLTDRRMATITGSGPERDSGMMIELHFNPILEQIFGLQIPVIAAVKGGAAGAGCAYALAADLVIAAKSAYFLQAFINIGLVPDSGATWTLPRLVGRARASAMLLLGERIPAERALEWGMIHDCVEDQALDLTANAMAVHLASGPTLAYAMTRQGIRQAMDSSLSQTLAMERENQKRAGRSADFAEGVAAFRERRPARFQGK